MQNQREIRTIGADYAPRLREVGEGQSSRTIEGYAIVFGRESVLLHDSIRPYREIIEPGAITMDLINRSDIKMTLWHNRERLLARRDKGAGTLEVGIDEKGVWYRFNAPHTPDGDTALELVRRGDLSGSSFIYWAKRDNIHYEQREDGSIIRHVDKIDYIRDMTIASDEAYKDTTVNAREVMAQFEPDPKPQPQPDAWRKDVDAMKREINTLTNICI